MAVIKVEEMEEEDLLREEAEVDLMVVAKVVVVNPTVHLLEVEEDVVMVKTKTTIANLPYMTYANTTQLEVVPMETLAGKLIVLGVPGAIREELWPSYYFRSRLGYLLDIISIIINRKAHVLTMGFNVPAHKDGATTVNMMPDASGNPAPRVITGGNDGTIKVRYSLSSFV